MPGLEIALDFFKDHDIPFWEMENADALVGNELHDNSVYCFAKPGEIYVVYLPATGPVKLNLDGAEGPFQVRWYNPRTGGGLQTGSIDEVQGGSVVNLGEPPADPQEDWVVLVK